MAHNLAITLFILAVYVAAMVTPFVYATKSSSSTTVGENEATKEGDVAVEEPKASTKGFAKDHKAYAKGDVPAKALDATTKGSTKDHEANSKGGSAAKASEATTKGYAKVPKANAKGAAAKGPGAPMSWADGGPEFVEMVIKNPFLKTTPPTSDGLPIDPTPEGSMT